MRMLRYFLSVSVLGTLALVGCSGGDETNADGTGGGAGSGAPNGSGASGTGGTPSGTAPLTCGNGKLDAGEQCDGALLNDATCVSLAYDGGTLSCADNCKYLLSACTGEGPQCGDKLVEGAEECEPGVATEESCATQGADGGTIACGADCYFDLSACRTCGNALLEDGEACDGTLLGGASCATKTESFPLGDLACADDCQLDVSDCHSANDLDADGVVGGTDPDDNDKKVCGDSDGDDCDDCSVLGVKTPTNDGYDPDGDGTCEVALDYDCMNGANADTDPDRLLACVVFSHMNNDRAYFKEESGNAAPLKWNEEIWEVAYAHSKDMCERDYFAHTTLGTSDGPSERAEKAGLSYGLAENIALNFGPNAVEFAFMDEPTCVGHRGNILTPKATEIGVGYYICPEQDDAHHVTADYRWNFSTPASAFCQAASTACEVPPEPLTTAVCAGIEINWDLCDRTEGTKLLSDWSCPSD